MDTLPPPNPLVAFVERYRNRRPQYDWVPVVEKSSITTRRLKPVPAPAVARPAGSLEETRTMMRAALFDYLAEPEPAEMLLIQCSPGTGKTTLAVEAADRLAAAGKRVAYAGPRHDLFLDLTARSCDPSQWYEWLPRRYGSSENMPATCRYAAQIQVWLQRGYAAIDFCSGVCGWDYVRNCPYHAQKGRREPVIYIQHQHITSGHPLRFDVLFGDENPLQTFTRPWRIPAQWVYPPGMDPGEPLAELLSILSCLCSLTRPLLGPELIETLGGAEAVIQACELFLGPCPPPPVGVGLCVHPDLHIHPDPGKNGSPVGGDPQPGADGRTGGDTQVRPNQVRPYEVGGVLETTGDPLAPAREFPTNDTHSIHTPADVARIPYRHLVDLAPLLLREARQAQAGRPYPHRIIAAGGSLTLLLRYQPSPGFLPSHVIWLDATARPPIYQALFHRPLRLVDAAPRLHGRIFQVVDRANGKASFQDRFDKHGKRISNGTLRRAQAIQLIRHIVKSRKYHSPSVIGFKEFVEQAGLDGSVYRTAHFYAARGDNTHAHADAVFIAGAPQPDIFTIIQTAKMIHFERDTAFDITWSQRELVYPYVAADGCGRSYPISGFWHDPALQALLESMREDEILQAAHRGRPVTHPCDIWLLTNLPIPGLPPGELLSMREALGAPERVRPFKWDDVMQWLEGRSSVTATDLMELGMNRKTAYIYIDKLIHELGWQPAAIRSQHGKPGRGAHNLNVR